MAINTGQAIGIARKLQSAKGVPATGAGGLLLKARPSPGLNLVKAYIENDQIRDDGITDVGRHSTRHSNGSYEVPFVVGGMEDLIEAVFRGTFAGGSLIQGVVERYFTFEQWYTKISKSKTFSDVKVVGMEFNAQPDANIILTFRLMGLDADSGASRVLTSPAYTTASPLVMADGAITINDVEYAVLTALSFNLDLGGDAPSVLAPVSPDVFLANAKLTGTFTAFKQDMVFFDAFKDETPGSLLIECVERNGPGACSFEIPNVSFTGDDDPLGGSSGLPETVPWAAGAGQTQDDEYTMIKYVTNADIGS